MRWMRATIVDADLDLAGGVGGIEIELDLSNPAGRAGSVLECFSRPGALAVDRRLLVLVYPETASARLDGPVFAAALKFQQVTLNGEVTTGAASGIPSTSNWT